jgi:hypothetical protein
MRAVSIALVAALFLILSGCERWALDKQMEELCKPGISLPAEALFWGPRWLKV